MAKPRHLELTEPVFLLTDVSEKIRYKFSIVNVFKLWIFKLIFSLLDKVKVFHVIYALCDKQRGSIEDPFLNFWVFLKVKHAKEMIEGIREEFEVLQNGFSYDHNELHLFKGLKYCPQTI